MKPQVLFVCPRHGGRSRMAAAFLEHLAGDRYDARSAGPEPDAGPGPDVQAAMSEVGIELAATAGTRLTPDLASRSAVVVGMGGAVDAACAALTVPREEWGIPDLDGRRQDEVRVIRDTVRRLVERLIGRLDAEAAVR